MIGIIVCIDILDDSGDTLSSSANRQPYIKGKQ